MCFWSVECVAEPTLDYALFDTTADYDGSISQIIFIQVRKYFNRSLSYSKFFKGDLCMEGNRIKNLMKPLQ